MDKKEMINKLIKMQYKECSDNLVAGDGEIRKLENKINSLLCEIEKTNPELSKELDSLFGDTAMLYGEICFKAGFKDGINLVKEIYD